MTTSKPRSNDFIPAAEANRRFSELLRGVKEEGKTFTITSHGRPVAQISAPEDDAAAREVGRRLAWDAIRERWRTAPGLTVAPWTRDELYDRKRLD